MKNLPQNLEPFPVVGEMFSSSIAIISLFYYLCILTKIIQDLE